MSSLLVVLTISCSRYGDPLPPKTREGRHTIGYYLESNQVLYRHEFFDTEGDGVVKVNDTIRVTDVENHNVETNNYYHDYLLGPVIFEMNFAEDQGSGDYKYVGSSMSIGTDILILDSTEYNYCNLEYHNAAKRIISGTFELNFNYVEVDSFVEIDTTIYMYNYYPIKLSKGRFDLRY